LYWRVGYVVSRKVIYRCHKADGSVGLLGVGFPDPIGNTNSWIVEAYQRGMIPAPVFSLTLGRYLSNGLTEGSLMVIGGYDEDQIDGTLNWIHTSGNIHVQVPMDGVIVNGVTLVRQDGLPMEAIIDVIPSYVSAKSSPVPGESLSVPSISFKRSMISLVGLKFQVNLDTMNSPAIRLQASDFNSAAKIT